MSKPLRRFRYLNTYRLDELYGESARSGWRKRVKLPVVTGFSFKVFMVGAGVTLDWPKDPRVRLHDEIEHIETFLTDRGDVGSFDDPRSYFHGFLAMTFVPFRRASPVTLYMSGETEQTVVALGGKAKYVVDVDDMEAYTRSDEGAELVHTEREVARLISDSRLGEPDDHAHTAQEGVHDEWERNVVETQQRFSSYPSYFPLTTFEVLAFKEDLAQAVKLAGWLDAPKAVLIGKPLWVSEGEPHQSI
jgi:Family of unknown function (DUF7019)